MRSRLPSSCFPEAADDAEAYHPYRYHHPLPLGELRERLDHAGFEMHGAGRFLWVPKTLPDALLPVGRAAESALEALPLVSRMGATTLVWATKRS